jgi:Cathepsin propeptide inhibitor domain (I29)
VLQFFVAMSHHRGILGTKPMDCANDDDETDTDQDNDVALNQEEQEDLPAWRSFRPLTAAHPEAASAAVANLESFLDNDDEKDSASRTPQYRRTLIQSRTEPSRRLFGVVSTVESEDDEDDLLYDSRPQHWTTGKATTDPRGQQQFLYNSKPLVFTPPPRIKLADSFDPYASSAALRREEPRQSLLDVSAESSASSMMDNEDDDDDMMLMMTTQQQQITPIKNTLLVPGSAGYLELEEDPSSSGRGGDDDFEDPIRTESGLLLTHRRPVATAVTAVNSNQSYRSNTQTTTTQRGPMDIEPAHHYRSGDKRSHLLPTTARRIATGGTSSYLFQPPFHSVLRYAKLSVACSALILLFGTTVLWHHSTPSAATGSGSVEYKQQTEEYTDLVSLGGGDGGGEVIQLIPLSPNEDTIVLLPLPEDHGQKPRRRLQGNELVGIGFQQDAPKPSETLLHRHLLNELRNQFQHWMVQHDKLYHSESETARRFSIWQHNRHRTASKNARHGPCLMTGKTVFGDNHLQDLSTDEFRTLYLNGAGRREPMERGSADDDRHHRTTVLEPRRLLMFNGCKWYNVSCNLRYFFSTYLNGLGGTMASKKVFAPRLALIC